MKPNYIKALLIRGNIKQTDIARRLGVKPSSVNRVITGSIKSQRISQAIAQALDLPVTDLWPAENN